MAGLRTVPWGRVYSQPPASR